MFVGVFFEYLALSIRNEDRWKEKKIILAQLNCVARTNKWDASNVKLHESQAHCCLRKINKCASLILAFFLSTLFRAHFLQHPTDIQISWRKFIRPKIAMISIECPKKNDNNHKTNLKPTEHEKKRSQRKIRG